MDQYLARKKKNSVHYDEVPEVVFQELMYVKICRNAYASTMLQMKLQ